MTTENRLPKCGRGRPTKYQAHFCDQVIDLAKEGKFQETWIASLGISRSAFYRWQKRHPEFKDACELARLHLMSYWTELAASKASSTTMPTKVLLHILRTRFPEAYGNNPTMTYEHFLAWNG